MFNPQKTSLIQFTHVLSGLPGERPWSEGKISSDEKMRRIITNQMISWNNEHLQPCQFIPLCSRMKALFHFAYMQILKRDSSWNIELV